MLIYVKPESVKRLKDIDGEYTGTIIAQSEDNDFNKGKVWLNKWFSINYIGENGFRQCPEANAEVRWFIEEHEYKDYGIGE